MINPRLYQAANDILAEGSVGVNDEVTFSAHGETRLMPGFKSPVGSKLIVDNNGCDFGSGVTDVQELLDIGYYPLELYYGGVPLEAIYGKTYQNGVIFFLDTANEYHFDGLLAAHDPKYPNGPGVAWDYNSQDNPYVPNVMSDPPIGIGANFGDGEANTQRTAFNVSGISVIRDVFTHVEYYDGADYRHWFMPSIQTLKVLRDNLYPYDNGQLYWSSTEYDAEHAWALDTDSPNSQPVKMHVSSIANAHPIRWFRDGCDPELDNSLEIQDLLDNCMSP